MNPLDPLQEEADPRLYVPIDSAECALATISMSLRAGCSPVLLTGPSGIGKTLLLRVMAQHEREAFPRVRYLAGLPPAPGELAGLLLQALFAIVPPQRSRAAEIELVHRLQAEPDGRSLLLVDDVQRASEACIRKLAELARVAKPALAIVAAGASLEDHHALTDALAAGFSVLLPESLPAAELQVIYDAIRVHPGLSPSLREQLEKEDAEEILSVASGRPRLLKRELARWDFDAAVADVPIVVAKPRTRRAWSPAPVVARARAVAAEAQRRASALRPGLAASAERVRDSLARTAEVFAASASRAASRSGEISSALGSQLAARAESIVREGSDSLARTAEVFAASASRAASRSAEISSELRSHLGKRARSAVRVAWTTALPIALLLAATVIAVNLPPLPRLRPQSAPAPQVTESVPAKPVPARAKAVPVPAPVEVQVNARPWARIWIDGKDLGPTPLKRVLPRGAHRLEAKFPNGKQIQRDIDVAPERRFVKLP